jgi:ABC-type bacteriocin/lantibiotic exporter with double-glycine peptidase domain
MSHSHDHSLSPLVRLRELAALERQDIAAVIAYSIGVGVMSLATPVAVQSLVNTIAFGALFQPLVVLTLVLFVFMSLSNLLVGVQFYVVEMLQRRLFVRLLGDVNQRLLGASAAARDGRDVPELVNRFFDVLTVQKTGAVLLLEAVAYLLQSVIGMVLLAFYHPMLLAFDLFLLAAMLFILKGLGRGGVATAIEQSKAKYAAVAWLEDLARNPLLGKSSDAAAYLTARTDQVARRYLDACAGHFRIVMGQTVGSLTLHTLASTLLLGMGGWMVIERQLSLGQLIAAELVVGAMIVGLTRLGKLLDNYYELLAAMDKIGHLLELPQEHAGGTALASSAVGAMAVHLDGVLLTQGLGEDLPAPIDLDIAAGDRLALTGDGFADRGILLDVLYGLRAPAKGSVRLDGLDMRELSLGELRRSIALVREAEIFHGTVLDNLSLGRSIAMPELRAALDEVGLLEDILALPDGLDTLLSYHAGPLGPEQSLRLSLARAIAGRPRLLLLHSVLDRLDRRLAPTVIATLLSPQRPWTVIATSHNPEVLAHCNRVGRYEDGRLRVTAP